MDSIQILSTFKPELLTAYAKMIKGIRVEITDKCREFFKDSHIKGRWFFITAISCDERITIQDQRHGIYSGLRLDDIIL